VLDSTDPAEVLDVERRVDLAKTLFIISSKSGGTIETLSHYKYFRQQVADAVGDAEASKHFVAVTDPGSPLVALAQSNGFRRVFENDPDIGGRYSVLSYFGLVPAACMGVTIEALLHRCQVAEQNCTSYDQGTSNSGLWLGIVMGALANAGRDKLTFIVSEPISSFGLWVEQLVAESTGKQGKGVLPVADEPIGPPEVYGDDRLFAYLRNADEPDEELDAKMDALAKAGQPVLTLSVHGATDLGRIFFFAEFAVAVGGWAIGINPFDQPNVQEAKDNTDKVLAGYEAEGHLPEVADADDDALRALLADAGPPHYVAVLGYLEPSARFDRAVVRLREALRAKTGAAVTFGYGPRFQHSTGQMHKGGPPVGRFLQLVHDHGDDVEIPGEPYSFRTLKHAAATGDLQTLRDHGLPAERVTLEGDPVDALHELTARIESV
jgi:glucose-6-phosphate isomerase/transaldolase/glucose-6-phosphate isomerase